MRKKAGVVLLILGWSAAMFGTGWWANSRAPAASPVTASAGLALTDEVWKLVRAHFVGQLPSDTVREYGAIRGMLSTLDDRWTVFVEPRPRAIERDQLRGRFGGIGVNLSTDELGRFVLSPMPDSPAAAVGIQDGDILIGIDGVPLPVPASFEDVASRVRGEVGSLVRITVLRGGRTLDFDIVRSNINIPSVEWRLVSEGEEGGRPVGHIIIRQFTERTGSEVKRAITELREAGSQAYLIDLRDNTGGLLSAAVKVASQFMKSGNVLIERKRNAPDVTYAVTGGGLATEEPIAVLVNGNTASASEIVAGALQDNGRARLIGDKTFGKGSVQLLFDLSDGSSVHVTTAKWLTPKGRAIDGVGLTPDIPVARDEGGAASGADAQLDRAVQFLQRP